MRYTMKIEKIKPIPKYILALIKKEDKKHYPTSNGITRYYSYLTKNDGELVKVTVAVRHYYKQWLCKQVVVHGLNSDYCIGRDMVFYYIGGYHVGWFDMGVGKAPKWYEDGKWYANKDKSYDPYATLVNKDYLAKFPEFKYSAYELFQEPDILKYLRLYLEYPQLEYLMKLGLAEIYDSKQILRKLGEDIKFRKWLARNRNEIKTEYYVSTILNSYKKNLSLQETQAYEEAKKQLCTQRNWKDIKGIFQNELEKLSSYIGKQKTSVSAYYDYLTACQALNLDMNLPKNRYPHDFRRWHDIRIDEYKTLKAQQDAEKRKELYSKFSTVARKYLGLEYAKKSVYIAIIAQNPSDLIREGEILHHCVGRMNYDQKMVREESLIFFIRMKNSPNTPLVTVEYSPTQMKVLQCYGDHDRKPSEDVLDFVNKKWLPYANRQIKKIAA